MRPNDEVPEITDVPVGPKGSAVGNGQTLAREWTALSPEEELIRLEECLDDARRRGDTSEVERIEARLRMLHQR
jgi:hypothetical protein